MRLVIYSFIFFLPISFALFLCGCPAKNNGNPSSPGGSSGASGATSTTTNTQTCTATMTLTPACTGYVDLTSYVNGSDYSGDDTNDKPALYMDGLGPNGDVYTITLPSSAQLTISLCPTENPPSGERDMYLAVRTGNCWSSDITSNDDFCDLLPQVSFSAVGGTTYYIIVAENSEAGAPYKMRLKTGSLPVIATVSPTSTPQSVVQGAQSNCGFAYDLGHGAPLGTGDSVATGLINDTNSDDYYKFTLANPGAVTVILDSYDNGLNQADFDIYGYSGCSGTTDQGSVGSSTAPSATHQQFVIANPMPSQTYYVDVNAYFGGSSIGTDYRLTVQTP